MHSITNKLNDSYCIVDCTLILECVNNFAVMMREPLEYYVAQVDKLRLVRMNQRSGLVRARLAGVQKAKGPVLVFLDSHVECEEGICLLLV